MRKFLFTASLVALFATSVNAAPVEMKPYVGFDYIYSNIDYKYKGMDKVFEENYNSGSLNVGAKLNQYFGAELFYQKSLEAKKTVFGIGQTKTSFYSFGLDAIGYLPIQNFEKVELLGVLGTGRYKYTIKGEIPTLLDVKGSDDGWGLRTGVGAQYKIDEQFSVRAVAKYTWLNVEDIDGMFDFSVGVRYNF